MSKFELEFRSGMEWKVRYEEEMPVEGYIEDVHDGSRVAEVVQDNDGLFVGHVGGEAVTNSQKWFDEAVDETHRSIWGREELWSRCKWHDQGGIEGIYKLGEEDGKVYVANAFWSDSEPGYANFSVFEADLAKESMEILTSGFYNGYLSIEDCIKGEAFDRASTEPPSFEHVCSCNWEIETFEDLAEALDEHDLRVDCLGVVPERGIGAGKMVFEVSGVSGTTWGARIEAESELEAYRIAELCYDMHYEGNSAKVAGVIDSYFDGEVSHTLTVTPSNMDVVRGPHRDEVAELKQEVIDAANERTNDAFDDVMTYERAVCFFDEPGLGLPMFIEDKVARIEKFEEAAFREGKAPDVLDSQIEEAQTASKDMQERSDRENLRKDKEICHEK